MGVHNGPREATRNGCQLQYGALVPSLTYSIGTWGGLQIVPWTRPVQNSQSSDCRGTQMETAYMDNLRISYDKEELSNETKVSNEMVTKEDFCHYFSNNKRAQKPHHQDNT